MSLLKYKKVKHVSQVATVTERSYRHLTEIKDPRLWVQSPSPYLQFYNLGLLKKSTRHLHRDWIHRGRKGHKNQFWVYVEVYQQLTKLGRKDSAVAKPKFTTVQIFTAAWGGRRSLCM